MEPDLTTKYDLSRWELAARAFRSAPTITLPALSNKKDSIALATIRDPPSGTRDQVPLASLSPWTLKSLLHKDAAVYNLSVPYPEIEDAFDALWRAAYPKRAAGWTGKAEAWFGAPFKVRREKKEEGVGIGEVVEVHEMLVGLARGLGSEGGEEGGLLETAERCFVVLDKADWERDGALLVCRADGAGAHGLDLAKAVEVVEVEGEWRAWRVGLEEAVGLVVCDEERRRGAGKMLASLVHKKLADGLM